jgi:cytoskeletal protein RodZ
MNLAKLRDKRIPRLRIHFRPIETAIILGVLLLGTSGILYQKHEQKVHEKLNIAPTSSQSSVSSNASTQPSRATTTTPSTSTQPTQTTTQSTVSTTTKPKSSTPTTSYPTVIDGMVWASSTCHYAPGYGEAFYRNMLVNSLQTYQSGAESSVSSTINQYNEYQLLTSQQALTSVNSYITNLNSGISTAYAQYVSDVNSIGCATTIDTANVPQVQPCTDLSGTVCFDSIEALSIPSLE